MENLERATRRFMVEDPATTWRLLVTLLVAIATVQSLTTLAPAWPMKLGGAVLLGLLNVRLFIFFHDTQHGAIFRHSSAGRFVVAAAGCYLMTPPGYWRFSHNRHHAHNGELAGSLIGEFPLVDVDRWRGMSSGDRLAYRIVRSPANLALGYLTIFVGIHCLCSPFLVERRRWEGPFTLLAHAGGLALIAHTCGWQAALFNGFLPVFLACTFGGALFYVQHAAPSVRFDESGRHDLTFAALQSSTMLEMSRAMHWFTGNIGYHHVHHVNPRIPFYRLPEAMAGVAALQSPPRARWLDFWKCTRLKLWDPARQEMVGYRD